MPTTDENTGNLIKRIGGNEPGLEEVELRLSEINDSDLDSLVAALTNNSHLHKISFGRANEEDDSVRVAMFASSCKESLDVGLIAEHVPEFTVMDAAELEKRAAQLVDFVNAMTPSEGPGATKPATPNPQPILVRTDPSALPRNTLSTLGERKRPGTSGFTRLTTKLEEAEHNLESRKPADEDEVDVALAEEICAEEAWSLLDNISKLPVVLGMLADSFDSEPVDSPSGFYGRMQQVLDIIPSILQFDAPDEVARLLEILPNTAAPVNKAQTSEPAASHPEGGHRSDAAHGRSSGVEFDFFRHTAPPGEDPPAVSDKNDPVGNEVGKDVYHST